MIIPHREGCSPVYDGIWARTHVSFSWQSQKVRISRVPITEESCKAEEDENSAHSLIARPHFDASEVM